MVKFTNILKSKSIRNDTKLRIMMTLVWQKATWGCEAWTLRIEEEKRIEVF